MLQKTIISFLLFLFLVSCNSNKDSKVLRLAHGLPVSHPTHLSLEKFAEDVAERSNGKLRIKIYPSEQLGSERDCLELLQIGSLDLSKVSAATLGNFDNRFTVFSLPYLMENKKHRYQFFESELAQRFLNGLSQFKLKGLTFYDAGCRNFYSSTPIRNSQDLAGMKIRVMKNPKPIEMVNALGGSATPISFGELYSALQQGVVDGAENNPSSFYSSKHYELCKHYTLDEHLSTPDLVIMSQKTWDKLNDEEQKWIGEAIYDSHFYQRKKWDDTEIEIMEKLVDVGVTIYEIDKTEFMNLTASMYDKDVIGQSMFDLVAEIKALANEK